MISVGIDVSKGKSMVCITNEHGEILNKPFEVKHLEKDLNELSEILLKFDDIRIKTYGSTDEGISFEVSVESKVIFHAGDLNWWHWEGETEQEKEAAQKIFFKEIDILKGSKIDIAFFPVDPRLEDAYYYGGKYFIEEVCPKVFIPMHFQDCYYITRKFRAVMENIQNSTRVIEIEKRGQELDV